LNDWLSGDILVKLHKSEPKIIEKKATDDSATKVVMIGADGLPEIDS
jgi:hypothetical protein